MIVTEVGAGTIGVSWTTLLAARGHDVVVTDPRPDLVEVVDTGVRQFAPSLGADPDQVLRRVRCEPDLEAAVADVAVVQEQGPEDPDLKRSLFARIGRAAPDDALLLSSTSGILPTTIARDLDDAVAARLLVAHPFTPPPPRPPRRRPPPPARAPPVHPAAPAAARRGGRRGAPRRGHRHPGRGVPARGGQGPRRAAPGGARVRRQPPPVRPVPGGGAPGPHRRRRRRGARPGGDRSARTAMGHRRTVPVLPPRRRPRRTAPHARPP